jgi:hypothetical protein
LRIVATKIRRRRWAVARKSAAALAVVPGPSIDSRLAPPPNLSGPEAVLWAQVIDSKPADWFDVDTAPVLKEYVRAAVTCDALDARVKAALSGGDDLKPLLDMRDKESRRMVSMATKMRLTQQSQYSHRAAASANGRTSGKRPWEK